MPIEPIGILGLFIILIAWLPETIKNIRNRRVRTRIEFLLLYTIGSMLLTIHSIIISDPIFVVLNGLAAILSGMNLFAKFLTH